MTRPRIDIDPEEKKRASETRAYRHSIAVLLKLLRNSSPPHVNAARVRARLRSESIEGGRARECKRVCTKLRVVKCNCKVAAYR